MAEIITGGKGFLAESGTDRDYADGSLESEVGEGDRMFQQEATSQEAPELEGRVLRTLLAVGC